MVDSGKIVANILFTNKNGASVIDYLLMQHDCIHLIKSFNIENFNVFSCHAPLGVEIYVKGERVINDQCTCIEDIMIPLSVMKG